MINRVIINGYYIYIHPGWLVLNDILHLQFASLPLKPCWMNGLTPGIARGRWKTRPRSHILSTAARDFHPIDPRCDSNFHTETSPGFQPWEVCNWVKREWSCSLGWRECCQWVPIVPKWLLIAFPFLFLSATVQLINYMASVCSTSQRQKWHALADNAKSQNFISMVPYQCKLLSFFMQYPGISFNYGKMK